MKVLHVIPSLSPGLGGPTQVALNLVRALRDSGVDAEIVTTNDNGAELLDVPFNRRVEYQQVPVWFLPRFSPPMKEFIFSAALTRWLWQHVRDYNLLDNHYLFSYAPTCAGAIARWQNVPYTVRTMGQLTPWALAQSRLKKQLYALAIERRNLDQAAAIHCTSAAEAEDVRHFGTTAPIVTLPLGVTPPKEIPDAKQKLCQNYGISLETPIVLFLSRLHYKKRPDLLMKALGQIEAQHQTFHLILAGSGEANYVKELKILAAVLGLTDRTSFVGFVAGEEKDLLLQGSDLFVLPSFSENFGVAVAEALAAGLPVIVTPGVQVSSEIAEAEGGLVVDGNVTALQQAISQLLAHPALRSQLGDRGKLFAQQRYSWSEISKNLVEIYQGIIDRKFSND